MERISWNEIDFVKVGNATDALGKTGLTVLRFPHGAQGGLHISGGGPAARESGVLDPTTAPTPVNALVLGGGSAFGLCASDGVIEERHIGFPTAYGVVPIVCQRDIYDLSYGHPKARPTVQMAYDACESTFARTEPMSGNIGAGTGATVGKVCGMERAMKGGIGYAAAKLGDLVVGAVVVVNAFGNVYDRYGHALGGVMDEERQHILDACQLMFDQYVGVIESKPLVGKSIIGSMEDVPTIGVVVTNAKFTKGELTKIAMMATNGYARSIRPVGTLSDGDTIYAFSVSKSDKLVEYHTNSAQESGNKGANVNNDDHHFEIQNGLRRITESPSTCNIEKEVVADVNVVGTLAAELMSDAIEDTMRASRIDHSEFLANIIDLHEVKI